MSRAAKRRRWLRWRAYRYRCSLLTGRTDLTNGAGRAWFRAIYPIHGGRFFALPPWRRPRDEVGVEYSDLTREENVK